MRRVLHIATQLLSYVAWFCVMAMMLSLAADVLQRVAGIRVFRGAVEYNEVILVILTYSGLAYAQQTNAHVSSSVVVRKIPRKIALLIEAVGLCVVLLALSWVIWETTMLANASFEQREFRMGLAQVPIWPARMAIPLGLTALWFETLSDVVDLGRDLAGGAPLESSGEGGSTYGL